MTQRFHYFLLGALFSTAPINNLSAAPSLSFNVKDKSVGYTASPASISKECLVTETFPNFTTTLWYNSSVEPSLAVNPVSDKYMVAAWQQDRLTAGGALEIPVAYSSNGGKNWSRTTIPFQKCSGGFVAGRVSDPWLTYSADGSRVYLTVLQLNAAVDPSTQNQSGILACYSEDNGKTWSNPDYVAAGPNCLQAGRNSNFDKNSATADPQLNNTAYIVWNTFLSLGSYHADTWMSRTTNGGVSWEDPRLIYNPSLDPSLPSNENKNDCQTIGNIIVGLPNGDLLCFMSRIYAKPGATNAQYRADVWPYKYTDYDIACVRSRDKGLTWTTEATKVSAINTNSDDYTCGYTFNSDGSILKGNGEAMRTASQVVLFSVAVNPTTGVLYVVWEDSRFTTPGSGLSQIALSLSRDNGTTWTAPMRVNRTPSTAPNGLAFTPSVAVTNDGKVGILYHDFRNSTLACATETKTDAWLAVYQDTGSSLDFIDEARLSTDSYIMENGPVARGIMTNGDYNSLIACNNNFHALYIKSFNGPFSSKTTPVDSPSEGTLILDNNRRSGPFFSSVAV